MIDDLMPRYAVVNVPRSALPKTGNGRVFDWTELCPANFAGRLVNQKGLTV